MNRNGKAPVRIAHRLRAARIAVLFAMGGVISALAPVVHAHVAFVSPPTVQKSFAPQNVGVGQFSRMSITLTNHDPINAITGVQFTDNYPQYMVNPPTGETGTIKLQPTAVGACC